jgi:hypothetical protein
MEDRAAKWLCKLLNSHLPAKWAWVSYKFQLWAGLRYGLGTNSAPLSRLRTVFPKFIFQCLPRLGVNRHIKRGYRHLHSAFCGLGMFSLPIETTISRVNLFLQHWGAPTMLGNSLRCSLELLQLESGLASCPLLHPFLPLGPLCTPCWLRSFWECIDHYRLSMRLNYPALPPPPARTGQSFGGIGHFPRPARGGSPEFPTMSHCNGSPLSL